MYARTENSDFMFINANWVFFSSILGVMCKLNSTKVTSLAITTLFIYFLVITSFLFTLPVIRSMSLTESAESNDGMDSSDRIDGNMAFLMFPEEVSVKVNDTFAIQVGVENATDMYGWQVCLSFDPEMLNCVDVYLPFDHVFSFGITVGGALVDYSATEFTNPLYKISNSEGRMLAGNCLLGANQSTFTGSGTLCQIEFRVISNGVSPIKLLLYSNFDSFILDSKISGVKPLLTVESLVTCPEP